MSYSKKIAIIGSGIAGLATAIRLSSKGHKVTVFEKEHHLGGKMGQISSDGYRFDTGPSLFTQPYLVDELLELDSNHREFQYQRMDISCKYFWEDGTTFSAFEDKELLSKELVTTFPDEQHSFIKRLNKAEEMYNLVGSTFIEKPLNKVKTWLTKDVAKSLLRLPKFKLNKNMHAVNAKDFKNPKVQQLFDRFATYNGSNPYQAPALLNMIPHLELNLGTFYPQGGLRNIPDTLIDSAQRLGVDFRTNEAVTQIKHNKKIVTGIETSKDSYDFDAVVSNADIYPTYKYLLKDVNPPKKTLEQERSSSGIIFYWGIKKAFPQLELHNIFFSENYKQEFEELFKTGAVTDDPTIYLNISSQVDK